RPLRAVPDAELGEGVAARLPGLRAVRVAGNDAGQLAAPAGGVDEQLVPVLPPDVEHPLGQPGPLPPVEQDAEPLLAERHVDDLGGLHLTPEALLLLEGAAAAPPLAAVAAPAGARQGDGLGPG